MPSPRSAIVVAVALFALVLGTAILSTLATPDSGGVGRDSFGVEAFGQRGLHDTLHALGIPVSRRIAPPEEEMRDATVVLLGPSPSIVGFNSLYLSRLMPWVEAGGRIVVAPRPPRRDEPDPDPDERRSTPTRVRPVPWAEALGLEGLEIEDAAPRAPSPRTDADKPLAERGREIVEELLEGPTGPGVVLADAECTGRWSPFSGDLRRIALPAARRLHIAATADGEVATLRLVPPRDDTVDAPESAADKGELPRRPVAALAGETPLDEPLVVAAEYARGSGSIVVIADPALVSNRYLVQADNSVAAVRLLAPDGGPVVFEEFFHGLGPRGQVLWLLTRPGFAAVGAGILATVLLVVWRKGTRLGPPLADRPVERRGIGEYLDAMGHLLSLGGGDHRAIVADVRDGVVRQLNTEFGLPPEHRERGRLEAAMARRDPARARRVAETIEAVDRALDGASWTTQSTLQTLRRLAQCL